MVEILLDFGCECDFLQAIWLADTNSNIRIEEIFPRENIPSEA
jgi:hypothetical protein